MNDELYSAQSPLSWAGVTALAVIWLFASALRAQGAAPDGQYVRDWLVAGPVSADASLIAKIVATLPAALVRPEEGRSLGLPNGEQIAWTRYASPGSIVNLIHALGQHEHVSGLACTTIHAAQAGEVRFRVGSDDQMAVLLNRRLVYLYDRGRPLSPDEDTFTAPLQAGANECVAIVGQGTGNWGFTLRLTTDDEPRPPLVWDAVDVLEQHRELYSPHWRHCLGDDVQYARADYDDARWKPLSPTGEAVGVKDARVVWFRCPVWVRPSLVGLPCSLRARLPGRLDVFADGVQVATLGDTKPLPAEPGRSFTFTPAVPFSFHAPQQVLAVRVERSAETCGGDRLDLRLAVSAMTQAGAEYDAGLVAQRAKVEAEIDRLRAEAAGAAHAMWLRLHRLIIIATLVLFLVFHAALLYFYPRRLANRNFCVTLSLTLLAMLVLHAQETVDHPSSSLALYWVFLALVSVCLLSGLALVQSLWCDGVARGKLLGWAAAAAVFYLVALTQDAQLIAFAILPLATLEYVRIYLTRALGKVDGSWLYGVGLVCLGTAQTVNLLEEFAFLSPASLVVPYCWVYGFVALLACVSVDIGREFAGAVRKLEDLTATLDSRVQQVSQQLETKLLAQARLQTLRYQLNPHFLYNALNSVEALSREDPGQIPEVVRRLCDCLRYSLQPKQGGLATLQQELDAVTSYLHVEEVRFEEQLQVELNVRDAARHAVVPEFLLQPLVENAIKYGMRTSDMPLRVVLSAQRRDGFLRVEVRNTGCWSTEAGPNADGHGGIGLENLASRLGLLYGDAARMKTGENAGWVSVVIEIPWKETTQHGDGPGDPG